MNLVERALALQRSRCNASLLVEERKPFAIADSSPVDRDIAQEIEAFSIDLLSYDISLDELADASPHSGRARKTCAAAVRALLVNPHAFEQVTALGILPMIYLSSACRLPRKILDRHRKYILATATLANGYPRLSEFINNISGGQGQ